MSPTAASLYQSQMIHFDSVPRGWTDKYGNPLAYSLQPHVGSQTIDDAAFFRLMGREDLARSYLRRYRIRYGMIIGASVLAGGGFLTGVGFLVSRATSHDVNAASLLEVSLPLILGSLGVGLPLIIVYSTYYSPSPIPDADMQQMADQYNQRLRNGLSAPRATGPADPTKNHGSVLISVRLSPWFDGKQGGLGVLGRF